MNFIKEGKYNMFAYELRDRGNEKHMFVLVKDENMQKIQNLMKNKGRIIYRKTNLNFTRDLLLQCNYASKRGERYDYLLSFGNL